MALILVARTPPALSVGSSRLMILFLVDFFGKLAVINHSYFVTGVCACECRLVLGDPAASSFLIPLLIRDLELRLGPLDSNQVKDDVTATLTPHVVWPRVILLRICHLSKILN